MYRVEWSRSPREICRLLRELRWSQMNALRGPYPYTPWTYHIQIAISINLHAVWYTVLWTTWFCTEDPSVAQSTVRVKVVYVDISLEWNHQHKTWCRLEKTRAIRIFQVLCQQLG